MASPVVGLSPVVSVSRVVALLRQTKHNGFPVLEPHKGSAVSRHTTPVSPFSNGASSGSDQGTGDEDGSEEGSVPRRAQCLLGIILRSQLLVMLETGFFCDADGAEPMPQSRP